ncbi:hypothetical protein HK096_005135, partial [Nowakowskiella sp. JEL0078]
MSMLRVSYGSTSTPLLIPTASITMLVTALLFSTLPSPPASSSHCSISHFPSLLSFQGWGPSWARREHQQAYKDDDEAWDPDPSVSATMNVAKGHDTANSSSGITQSGNFVFITV